MRAYEPILWVSQAGVAGNLSKLEPGCQNRQLRCASDLETQCSARQFAQFSFARLEQSKNHQLESLQITVTVPSEVVCVILRTQCVELSSTSSKATAMVKAKEPIRNTAFRKSVFVACRFLAWSRTRKNEMIPPVAMSQVPCAKESDVNIKLENDAKNLKNQ